MNLKSTLFGIFTVTLFSLGVWIVILFNVDPNTTDLFTIIAFLASLFLWLMGIATFINFYGNIVYHKREIVYAHLPAAIRHGILISLAIVILLSLQLMRVLNILEAILIVILIVATELYFRARINHA